ncbi:MAG: DUF507 family protein [Nitrospiria bacterium]
MRLSKARVDALSLRLATTLLSQQLIESVQKKETIAATIGTAILKELAVEERLDREVEQLMKKYERQMAGEQIDRHTLFLMIKKQLIKERGLTI